MPPVRGGTRRSRTADRTGREYIAALSKRPRRTYGRRGDDGPAGDRQRPTCRAIRRPLGGGSGPPVISDPSARLRPRMGPLAAVERFLERLFERQSARLFKTAIRPVQVQRRLERVMEGDRSRDGARTIVPHRFVVRFHPEDLAALRASAPQLAATLADGALA